MIQYIAGFSCAYSEKSSASFGIQTSTCKPSHRPVAKMRSRVLIGEFRDEVFADLAALFESQGFGVTRAHCGIAMTSQVQKSCPDLVVLSERFPDQSGWLVAAKLQMCRTPPRVWLYASRLPARVHVQQEVCRIDEVLAYGGILSRLRHQVLELIGSSFTAFNNEEKQQ